MQENTKSITDAWEKYQEKIFFMERMGLFHKTNRYHKFYEGEQWNNNVDDKGDPLVKADFLENLVNRKVSTICQKGFEINYSSNNYDDSEFAAVAEELCRELNHDAKITWEKLNMDEAIWDIVTNAGVAGDNYLYLSPVKMKTVDEIKKVHEKLERIEKKQLDGVNILYGDMSTPEIQGQPYILIQYREDVNDLKEEAEANERPEEEIKNIISDDEVEHQAGYDLQTESHGKQGDGKCVVLLYFKKEKGSVRYMKATRNAVITPWADTSLKRYPIAGYWWKKRKGSAYGRGEIEKYIDNQIMVNKTLARHYANLRKYRSKLFYNKGSIESGKKFEESEAIGINGSDNLDNDIRKLAVYMQPPPVTSEGLNSAFSLITKTMDSAGMSEIDLGSINPEKASGAAIVAVRDAAAAPLSGQAARLDKFIEDIALILIDLKLAYAAGGMIEIVGKKKISVPNAMGVPEEKEIITTKKIPKEDVDKLKLSVKIDISPSDSYSKFAELQNLMNITDELVRAKEITPKQRLELLPDDFIRNKQKILDAIKANKEAQQPPPLSPQLLPTPQMSQDTPLPILPESAPIPASF